LNDIKTSEKLSEHWFKNPHSAEKHLQYDRPNELGGQHGVWNMGHVEHAESPFRQRAMALCIYRLNF